LNDDFATDPTALFTCVFTGSPPRQRPAECFR
jgi:hypothetical protein